jgi:endonuclease YncB( thermonuclease family)
MNRFKHAFMLFLIITSIPSDLYAWEGLVVGVPEGDIITILKNDQQITIRLAAIDCPEMDMPYGPRARTFTARLVADKKVRVWPVASDSKGRVMAFVFSEKKNLNKELLSAGLAWHHKTYARDPELAKLAFKARSKKIGLWSQPNPIPPWEHKKKKDAKSRKINFGMGGGFCQGTQKNR